VVSGTKIAADLGITRTAVWRAVQQLRACGVQITGHPATGYQLSQIPDLLLPEVLEPMLRRVRLVGGIRHYFRISSTNVAAMQAAAAGELEGTVLVAEEQTAGKGRGGHTWQSEPSLGIYFSVILRPQLGPGGALLISLAAGLAVANGVREVAGTQCDLRWPNDLLLGGKKVCGILAEMNAEATRVRYLVLGIGLNVNQERFAGELAGGATSLRMEVGRKCSRVELFAALLKSLDCEYRRFVQGGPDASAELIGRFEAASSLARGARVRVEENGGFEGITQGLDEQGFLLVRTESGIRRVLSGGVRSAQP
jgi:BirA family biotin operon repressor/biotin-[acetyl-CoA-carboxylase] ligase